MQRTDSWSSPNARLTFPRDLRRPQHAQKSTTPIGNHPTSLTVAIFAFLLFYCQPAARAGIARAGPQPTYHSDVVVVPSPSPPPTATGGAPRGARPSSGGGGVFCS